MVRSVLGPATGFFLALTKVHEMSFAQEAGQFIQACDSTFAQQRKGFREQDLLMRKILQDFL